MSRRTACPGWTESVVTLLAAAALAASTRLVWLTAELGGRGAAGAPRDVPVAGGALLGAAALIAAGALAAAFGRPGGLQLSAVVATGVALLAGAFVVVVEIASALIPDDVLPLTVRRVSISAGAGRGAWLALAAALAVVVVAEPSARRLAQRAARAVAVRGPLTVPALAAIVAVLAAVVQLRQQAWLEADLAGRSLSVDGLAVPLVAPVTFAAVWAMGAGLVLVALGRSRSGALVVATGGWLASGAAGATIATEHLAVDVSGAHAGSTAAARWTFLLGLVAAVATVPFLDSAEVRP
jgi:hypothetical protein